MSSARTNPNSWCFIACCCSYFPCFVSLAKKENLKWTCTKMGPWLLLSSTARLVVRIHSNGGANHMFLDDIQLAIFCFSLPYQWLVPQSARSLWYSITWDLLSTPHEPSSTIKPTLYFLPS